MNNDDIKTPLADQMFRGATQLFTDYMSDIPDEAPQFSIHAVYMLIKMFGVSFAIILFKIYVLCFARLFEAGVMILLQKL